MDSAQLTVIIESHIPFADCTLDRLPGVRVLRLPPEDITPEAVRNCDALVVRTRTRCDARLLSGTKVRFIATATIGTDHIDLDWCAANGITVASAPGCNAPAVAQYVLSSVAHLLGPQPDRLRQLTIGIVGVGHVGRIVERWARGLGMNVLLCDPPRARQEGPEGFTDIETLAKRSDIVTFHVPLTHDCLDATYHLCDSRLLSLMRTDTLVINAARGPVVDTPALVDACRCGHVTAAIDCWEYEPDIDTELIRLAKVATPHIAGYSMQGKQRATRMALEALGRFFGLDIPNLPSPDDAPDTVTIPDLVASYDPLADTARLTTVLLPFGFEQLRNRYHYRNEPS